MSTTGMNTAAGIDYFNRGHWLTRYQVAASLRVRRQVFDWALTHCPAGPLHVLELGATPDTERPDSNCFARWFQERGDRVALASIEDLAPLRTAWPGVEIVAWDTVQTMPRTYDLVVSSAVLEHTGLHGAEHVALGLRLGRNFLLTTPNRHHWFEFHTKLPLIHWLPRRMHRALLTAVGMRFWADDANLRLYSRGELCGLYAGAMARHCMSARGMHWLYPRFLGLVSNLAVFAEGVA